MLRKRNSQVYSILLIICLLSALFVSGCSHSPVSDVDHKQKTVTITDCVGREVAIPANPQRIACLCPETGHALAMYGQGGKIVAAVGGMQRDLMLVQMYPHIKDVPVPKTSGVINIEELILCKPDLVFIKGDTIFNEAEMDKLNKAKIPVLGVNFSNMEEQQYAMKMIAETVGAQGEAQKYIDFYKRCIDLVQDRVREIPDDQRVSIYHSVSEATRTDARDTLPADWTRAAGVNNVSVNQELKLVEGNHFASLEQILLWDPAYILVNDPNVVAYIMNHEQWRPLQAVKNKRVLALPNGISRWGHFSSLETPLAVLWTAKTVYPDKFADIDMADETRSFYKEFFDWELSDADVDKILSGVGMRVPKAN